MSRLLSPSHQGDETWRTPRAFAPRGPRLPGLKRCEAKCQPLKPCSDSSMRLARRPRVSGEPEPGPGRGPGPGPGPGPELAGRISRRVGTAHLDKNGDNAYHQRP